MNRTSNKVTRIATGGRSYDICWPHAYDNCAYTCRRSSINSPPLPSICRFHFRPPRSSDRAAASERCRRTSFSRLTVICDAVNPRRSDNTPTAPKSTTSPSHLAPARLDARPGPARIYTTGREPRLTGRSAGNDRPSPVTLPDQCRLCPFDGVPPST